VTPRHALLPAHCIQNKREKQADSATDADILFKNDYYDKMGLISKFIVHPDWDPKDSHYEADIAVAVLTERRNLTDVIRHVCLNTPSNPIQSFAGKIAEVYGWGLTKELASGLGSELRHVKVPLVDQAQCYKNSNPDLPKIISDTSFCAGAGDGKSGPSNGETIYEFDIYCSFMSPRGFLEGVYEIELDTKTEYEGFLGTLSTFQNGYF
jgi:hypothetical protein